MSDCNCPLTGFCEVRQIALKPTLQRICRENKPRFDRILISSGLMQTTAPTVGTLLLATLEAATGTRISCDNCLQYLTTLHRPQIPDCEEIVANLAASALTPPHTREQCDTQQKRQDWLRPIVESVLLEWVDSGNQPWTQ